ncbi:hypothetical protein [Nocardia bovistercoris]|uniref:Beta-ketoacyl-[acyl-carrier-protein] synthase III N-terminal domain-containing protein n=1 Tax=Nocardia bovistercoris TaxID=2785916 RepID=A0A931N087_9NOCA|nr:hypothetical protein [Nocardia bovistercoris]MBH0774784.1 hypothetical protein [Nocardia bovistercoris]
MGVRIVATGISRASDTASIVENSARAARKSLEKAGIGSERVGVLINAGIYRDHNTVEPAVAALIQKAAGIGLEYAEHDPRTFSFDLLNGAVGVLNAVQVATAILDTGSAEHVLVVSGDTHPSLTTATATAEFPYATVGAALLLARADDAGFGAVHTASGAGTPVVEAYVDTATMGAVGRGLMTVVRAPDFEQRLLEVALDAARAAVAELGDLTGVALIASTPTPQFPKLLADALGLDQDAVRDHELPEGDPHTAALPLAYHRAVTAGTLTGFDRVLFVAAGAGPSAAAALYRLPSEGSA